MADGQRTIESTTFTEDQGTRSLSGKSGVSARTSSARATIFDNFDCSESVFLTGKSRQGKESHAIEGNRDA
jgi:hypothetical protein